MADPGSLKDKVALVVGGAGGIGAATARQFAEAGARVVITHRAGRDKAAAANALLATFAGGKHAAFAADVADTATLIALREAIAATLWPARYSGQHGRIYKTRSARRSRRAR